MRLFHLASVLLIFAFAAPASACHRPRRVYRPVQTRSAPVVASSPRIASPASAPTGSIDFSLAAVNRARANAGLPPLAFDPALAAIAQANSAAGFGHWHFWSGFEAVASGVASPEHAVAIWLASPPHHPILFAHGSSAALVIVGGVATLQVR